MPILTAPAAFATRALTMDLDALRPKLAPLVQGRFGGDTRVGEIQALAGDASTRRYVRVQLHGGTAPPTAVVMILADRGVAVSSEELAVLPETAELPFVNVHRFLQHIGVAVPEMYADASDRGLLVLEDIGDGALRDAVEGAAPEAVERLYRLAIDQLLLLQLDGTRASDPDCIAFHQAFDERLYLWEFEHFVEFGIERRLGALPAAAAARLREIFATIAARLDREPRYLTHRDFHSWNLFVQHGRIRVIDFQDALMAAAPYDLATLLGDRDTPSVVSPELEARLLDYYREAWRDRGGVPWDVEQLRELYLLCALQKALKVVGRFHYLDIVKGKRAYLRYLPPTLRQASRLLQQLPQCAEIGTILAPYFPELRQ